MAVTMIYAHPRSRSTYLGTAYNNFRGEIFNLLHVNKITLEQEAGTRNSEPWFVLTSQLFAREYLDKVEKELTTGSCAFTLFFPHVSAWPDARDLIKSLAPKVVTIHRECKFNAIVSVLLANAGGGFTLQQTKDIPKFNVSFDEFFQVLRLILLFGDGYSWCKYHIGIQYEFTYETLLNEKQTDLIRSNIIDKELSTLPGNQHSMDRQDLITNIDEVRKWYDIHIQYFVGTLK